jgi:hypothetical protein
MAAGRRKHLSPLVDCSTPGLEARQRRSQRTQISDIPSSGISPCLLLTDHFGRIFLGAIHTVNLLALRLQKRHVGMLRRQRDDDFLR